MRRNNLWLSILLILLLTVLAGPAAADTIRRGSEGPVLADGTEVIGVWSNGADDFLTLKAEGEAVFCVGETLYACSWTWDADAIYLHQGGWMITVQPKGSTLCANVHDKALTLERVGDAVSNTGMWYESGSGGCSLQLKADGEYVLKRGSEVVRSGAWLDGGACVILLGSDGGYDVCIREGNRLTVRVGLTLCTLMQASQPTQTTPAPTATPAAQETASSAREGWLSFRRAAGSSGRGVTGTWVEVTQGENVTLSISSNQTAVLRVNNYEYDCQWSLVDGNLMLKRGYITIVGAYDSKTAVLELNPNSAQHIFRNIGTSPTTAATSTASATSTTSGRGITGTWTEVSLGSSVTLTIRSNTTAELKIYDTVYRCNWRLSNGVLKLTNSGASIDGTYNSQTGVIQLTVDTYQLSFRRNGTSATRSVVGTWTQHVVGGTVTLIVRADGSATLKIATTQYACTWKLSGSTFTLINNGSPVNGTYNSQTDTISITIGTARLNLTRTGN